MSLFRALLDILYPPRCPICNEFLNMNHHAESLLSGSICGACFADFHEIRSPLCPVCGKAFPQDSRRDHLCENCLRKRPAFVAAAAPYRYEGSVMKAIHLFKYGGKGHLADSLGPLLARFAQNRLSGHQRNLLVVPVPLHPKRLRQRGFNQSLLLARHVARQLNTGLDFLSLRRVKDTLPQTGLGKDERPKNVRRAFQVVNSEPLKEKNILLVDDVATTGSTLNECARALKGSGSGNVYCVVLARTSDL